jgi:folate-binding protein YgfZ
VPPHFGDGAAEIHAVLSGSAVIALAQWAVISVEGSDRVSFLNRLLTADMASLEQTRATPCLLLDNKGRVQACFFAVPSQDAILLFGEAVPLDQARETLSRYVLAADVKLQRTAHAVLALGSAAADEAAAALEAAPGTVARMAAGTFLLSAEWTSAWRALAATGIRTAGAAAAELWRILQLWPASEAELTGREFPQELGLEAAIDFNKGCYLGQETVARIHYRGGVNRLLCRLHSGSAVTAGADLLRRERRVGGITSAAATGADNGHALALVAIDEAKVGAELLTAGDVVVRVEAVAGTTET